MSMSSNSNCIMKMWDDWMYPKNQCRSALKFKVSGSGGLEWASVTQLVSMQRECLETL
jgi:hypothetical protein